MPQLLGTVLFVPKRHQNRRALCLPVAVAGCDCRRHIFHRMCSRTFAVSVVPCEAHFNVEEQLTRSLKTFLAIFVKILDVLGLHKTSLPRLFPAFQLGTDGKLFDKLYISIAWPFCSLSYHRYTDSYIIALRKILLDLGE